MTRQSGSKEREREKLKKRAHTRRFGRSSVHFSESNLRGRSEMGTQRVCTALRNSVRRDSLCAASVGLLSRTRWCSRAGVLHLNFDRHSRDLASLIHCYACGLRWNVVVTKQGKVSSSVSALA